MNVFIWMVAGAVLGWLTFAYMGWSPGRGKFASIMLGGMAGIFGGKIFGQMFAGADVVTADFSMSGLVCAMLSALVILVAANMIFNKWEV